MYPLLPWKIVSILLVIFTGCAVYVDDMFRAFGEEVADRTIVRFLPLITLFIVSFFFGPKWYFAPWRILWRWVPMLNKFFPDLNGVWLGTTSSNWPKIKKLIACSQSPETITEEELFDLPEQPNTIAVQIKNSLFRVHIQAVLTSTDGESYSITAKPWRHQHTEDIHLSYVYRQENQSHVQTDEECHLGAADLILRSDKYNEANGVYWTKRRWKDGRNTAGTLELKRVSNRLVSAGELRAIAERRKREVGY
ncbi:Cap15 family cyclic dinucleotide receptor domain-containing protein [Thalassospira sp. SM2505]